MDKSNQRAMLQVGLLTGAATILTIWLNQPYELKHGWWIFSYSEHVVPASYLVAGAWLIALVYLALFVRWYVTLPIQQADHTLSDQQQPGWKTIAFTVLAGGLISCTLTDLINQSLPAHMPASFAGLVEEPSKFAAMWLLCRNKITDIHSGIFYAVLCALGFAFFENILYFMHYEEIILIRGNPAHAVFSSFWGAAYGACRTGRLPWRKLWLKWMPAGILFHALFNTLLMLLLYPLSLWIAVRFIINHHPYEEFILARRSFREFLWRKSRQAA